MCCCNAMYSGRYLLTFQTNLLPPLPEWNPVGIGGRFFWNASKFLPAPLFMDTLGFSWTSFSIYWPHGITSYRMVILNVWLFKWSAVSDKEKSLQQFGMWLIMRCCVFRRSRWSNRQFIWATSARQQDTHCSGEGGVWADMHSSSWQPPSTSLVARPTWPYCLW